MNNSTVRTGWLWLAGFLFFGAGQSARAQLADSVMQRCATVEHEQLLRQRNPGRASQVDALNRRIQQAFPAGAPFRTAASDEIYQIPIVVHVIHTTADATIGGAANTNISSEQIASQIQVLNEDYRRQAGTNGANTSAIGADARIEFRLATTDPNGAPSTGITRHYYPQKTSFDAYSTEDDLLLAQIAYWPTDRYLNLWVVSLENRILGFGQFPTAIDTLQGLASSANERTDGVIIDYRYFGRQTGVVTSTTYNLGRTLTHEIGHWLGLIHLNGDGSGCNEDYVADTPATKELNNTTQCTQTFSTCTGPRTRDLIENYMMYSPDRCMNLFTQGQVDRMRAVIELSPRRQRVVQAVSALAPTAALTVNVYPNPVHLAATADVQFTGNQTIMASLIDLTGRVIQTYQYQNVPSTRISLTVSDIPVGMYLLRVTTGLETQVKRVFIQ